MILFLFPIKTKIIRANSTNLDVRFVVAAAAAACLTFVGHGMKTGAVAADLPRSLGIAIQ